MRLHSTMKSAPSGYAATLPSNSIIQPFGGWILRFRCLTIGSSCCVRMALLHTVREPQGVALQKRSLLSCPMFGSSLVNRSLGKDKDRPFDEHFPYLLELADHGLFDAKQLLFIVITISPLFQTKPDRLEDPDTEKWL